MFKRIIVAIDGSDLARIALKKAIMLAKQQNAKLFIIHVIDYAGISGGIKRLQNLQFNDTVKQYGEDLLNSAKQMADKHDLRSQTRLIEFDDYKGHVAEFIFEEAKTLRADLIVIGTQGLRGFKRIVLGSVADYAIRYSTIPVLVVPDKQTRK
jgi:nucleotide-binding universal stress UspA family protein